MTEIQPGEFRRYLQLAAILFVISLSGCSEDSDVSSGGGDTGVGSDGGSTSAQFAGTYSGNITISVQGDSIDDDSDTEPVTVLVRDNGTARLTIDGESVEGTVNGNRFGFSIRREIRRGLVECEGDAMVTGTIQSQTMTGPVSGSGECGLLVGGTGFVIDGSLTATKN